MTSEPPKRTRTPQEWLTGREMLRRSTAIIGIGLTLYIAISTFVDREDVAGTSERALVNIGLYAERTFMAAIVIALMIAVYIGTRGDD